MCQVLFWRVKAERATIVFTSRSLQERNEERVQHVYMPRYSDPRLLHRIAISHAQFTYNMNDFSQHSYYYNKIVKCIHSS